MYYQRRNRLSQNFLCDQRLVNKLILLSSIGQKDLVLEIGPGKGVITDSLLDKANLVIGIELDPQLCSYLKYRFTRHENFLLFRDNFLDFPLPLTPYKVFANLPFAIEGETIRKLINAQNPPQESLLIVRKQLAERLTGKYRENQFSLSHKPWFDLSVEYYFKRQDFRPAPKVPAVLLKFRQKQPSLLPLKEKQRYQQFIKIAFGQGLPIYQNLDKILGKQKTKQLLAKQGIALKTKPSWLTLEQWLNLYQNLKKLSS